MMAGGKLDFTAKHWDTGYWQRTVDILKDWGINVHVGYRVIRGERDTKHPDSDRFAINVQQWSYLQMNGFTDNPIGKPLKSISVSFLVYF